MITNLVIFALITGLLTGGVAVGAMAWARDLGLRLKWWKWLLAGLWYLLLLFLVFAAFTLMGEGESGAGWKILGITAVLMVILGAGLRRLLLSGKDNTNIMDG